MLSHSSPEPCSISLLHATYRAGASALEVRNTWFERATSPARVEHVFALDADDEISLEETQGLKRVVSSSLPGHITAVRNWNAAAAVSTGRLLFVIADDLTPPPGWDSILDGVVGHVDPERFAFAVRVADIDPDTDSRPTLMRHPVVSRRFYEKFGLFDPAYTGLFCDDDITLRSFWHAVVIDGSAVVLQHHREPARPTESQALINTDAELARGRRLRDGRWGSFRPPARGAFFRPPMAPIPIRPWAFVWRWQIRARARAEGVRRLSTRALAASRTRLGRARAWSHRIVARETRRNG